MAAHPQPMHRQALRALCFLAVMAPLVGGAAGAGSPVASSSAAPPSVAPRTPAPVMTYHGADWLERPSREAEEHPSEIIGALDLKVGDVVAEVGCGTGYVSRLLARAVGPTGRVYAEDIQLEMLALTAKLAAAAGLTNIVPVLGTPTDPRLPPHALRWVVLVDAYHEFQHPEPMLVQIRKSLAPGGEVALVEYRAEGESAAQIKAEHRMSSEQVLAEWRRGGFELVRQLEILPAQHLFILVGRRGARAFP
jgi:predicted methyltransferase